MLMKNFIVLGWLFALPLCAAETPVFNIRDFGAVGDGKTLDTDAIQKAVEAAAAGGGGRVLVPAGKFLTGPFTLASGVDFHLDRGAVLLISDDMANYPIRKNRYVDAIIATNAHDVSLTGEGVIDGQGEAWWKAFRANPEMTHRPYLIRFSDCRRVTVENVTLQNSPMFHLVPQNCTDVTIRHVTIHAPADAPNTDGIDPSGWNFHISDCTIDTGDDNIAIKPTDGRTPGDKNFLITDCRFFHGHGMSIGGGTFNGVEDVTVSHCSFDGTDSGIRLKTLRGRGGLARNLVYENLTMNNVKNPIYIIDYYPERTAPKDPATEKPEPVTDRTPINRHIIIRNLTATNCPTAGTIRGLPEMPIEDVMLTNVHLSAEKGLTIIRARGVRFENCSIVAARGPKVISYDAEISGLK